MGVFQVGIFQVGVILGGNFPGGSYPGWEFSLVGVFRVYVVRGESSGWQFFSSTFKIAKNQKFGLITYIISRYFKNLIFSKTRQRNLNSQWNLIPSRNLKR